MSAAAEAAISSCSAEARSLNVALMRIEKETVEKMEKLFNTAYYVCYLKMPFASFVHVCSLQEKNGLKLGQTYLNDHGCKEFCKHISQVIRDEDKEIIQSSHFLSIYTSRWKHRFQRNRPFALRGHVTSFL